MSRLFTFAYDMVCRCFPNSSLIYFISNFFAKQFFSHRNDRKTHLCFLAGLHGLLAYLFILSTFYFETIVGSQEMAESRGLPCPPPPVAPVAGSVRLLDAEGRVELRDRRVSTCARGSWLAGHPPLQGTDRPHYVSFCSISHYVSATLLLVGSARREPNVILLHVTVLLPQSPVSFY